MHNDAFSLTPEQANLRNQLYNIPFAEFRIEIKFYLMSDNENTNENPNSTSDNEGKEETGVVVSKIDNPKMDI